MNDAINNLWKLAEKYYEAGQKNGWKKSTADSFHTVVNQVIKLIHDKHVFKGD